MCFFFCFESGFLDFICDQKDPQPSFISQGGIPHNLIKTRWSKQARKFVRTQFPPRSRECLQQTWGDDTKMHLLLSVSPLLAWGEICSCSITAWHKATGQSSLTEISLSPSQHIPFFLPKKRTSTCSDAIIWTAAKEAAPRSRFSSFLSCGLPSSGFLSLESRILLAARLSCLDGEPMSVTHNASLWIDRSIEIERESS